MDGYSKQTREKLDLLFLGFRLKKFADLAAAIFPEDLPAYHKTVQANLNHYKNKDGNTSNPVIFRKLCERWEFSNTAEYLMYCSASEFFEAMPPEIAEGVIRAPHQKIITPEVIERFRQQRGSREPKPTLHSHRFGRGYHVVHVTKDYDTHDITKALDDGLFDQKYLYLDRTAAARWHNLTSNPGKYTTFRNCQDTLEELTGGKAWEDLVPQIETIVVMGGGSAKKDDIIIKSLLRCRAAAAHAVQYVVIDTSVHMLLSTMRELDGLVDHTQTEFLELVGFVADFTELQHTLRLLAREGADIHRNGKRAVFFLPGNTFANFNPEDILDNVFENSRPGDLFIISFEAVREGDAKPFADHLLARYIEKDLVDLVLPPIRPFLDKNKIDVISDNAAETITATPVVGHWSDLDHIRDSFTIEIRLVHDPLHIDVVLARSSRYTVDALVMGADRRGFDLIGKPAVKPVDPPGFDHCQIMLQRRASRQRSALTAEAAGQDRTLT